MKFELYTTLVFGAAAWKKIIPPGCTEKMALSESIFTDQLNKDHDYYPDVAKAGDKIVADYHSICSFGKDGIYETF